jgi:hypothetical protein
MTDTTTKAAPARDPDHDHDEHASGLYRAMALRFYCRYVDMRKHAEYRGSDLKGLHGVLPTALNASDQYKAEVEEWLLETPATVDAALAMVEFAAVIAADKLVGEALRESGPVSDEMDAFHQMTALAAVGALLNERAMGEWLERERKKPLPDGSHGSHVLDQVRAALDGIQAGKGGPA